MCLGLDRGTAADGPGQQHVPQDGKSIFVLPLWGVLWLAGRVKFRELWVFPVAYLAMIAPAAALGKPLGEIVGVYFRQMGEYPRLTLNAPSVYQFIRGRPTRRRWRRTGPSMPR